MRRAGGSPEPTPDGGEDRSGPRWKPEFEARSAERLAFFSDAVVAIAITLLAIELPVPSGDTVSGFWSSVRHEDGHYVAFLISFAAIAAAWGDHHGLFKYLERVDPRLRTLNTCWLLMIILNPFATRMLTVPGHESLDTHALRFGFYALLQALESLALLAMLRHMISCRLAPETPPRTAVNVTWQSYSLLLGFGLSIPFFFVTAYAWIFWFVIPLLIRRLHHRWHPHDVSTEAT